MRKFVVAAIVSIATIVSAHAADLTDLIKSVDGKELVDRDGKPLNYTFDAVIQSALYNEAVPSEDEKGKNFRLAGKVMTQAKDFNPTPDEIIRIRKALAATQPTLIYGLVMTRIDPSFAKQ